MFEVFSLLGFYRYYPRQKMLTDKKWQQTVFDVAVDVGSLSIMTVNNPAVKDQTSTDCEAGAVGLIFEQRFKTPI